MAVELAMSADAASVRIPFGRTILCLNSFSRTLPDDDLILLRIIDKFAMGACCVVTRLSDMTALRHLASIVTGVLAAVFIFAAIAKAFHPADTARTVSSLGWLAGLRLPSQLLVAALVVVVARSSAP